MAPFGGEGGWVDVSVPLRPGMPSWPGEPGFRLEPVKESPRVSLLRMGTHSGTHVDAPSHFLDGGAGVESIPPDALLGPAQVVEVEADRHVLREDLEGRLDPACERLLVKTANSRRGWPRRPATAFGLTAGAAEWLAGRRLRLVGLDHLSAAAPGDGEAVHRSLLSAGTCILEGLDLGAVRPGPHELACLPLLVPGADGAPARAMLRRLA